MDIVKTIRDFVEDECKKPTSKYGYEPFACHFIPMVAYAEKLCDELGGDKEIIRLAGWMHDVGSIRCGREDHHVSGAKIAEEKLRELKYPEDKIELIKDCILHHRGSTDENRETIEEKIIAEADVMSNFDNIAGVFQCAYIYEHLSREEANISVREKFKRKWNQLHFEKSKKLIRPKYEAAMLLLK